MKLKPTKKAKKKVIESDTDSESDVALPLYSSDSDLESFGSLENQDSESEDVGFMINDYVLVKYYVEPEASGSSKDSNSIVHYVGQITELRGSFFMIHFARCNLLNDHFAYRNVYDEDMVPTDKIVLNLPKPPTTGTRRQASTLTFPGVDFSKFENVK